jgi:hypothetical protein
MQTQTPFLYFPYYEPVNRNHKKAYQYATKWHSLKGRK